MGWLIQFNTGTLKKGLILPLPFSLLPSDNYIINNVYSNIRNITDGTTPVYSEKINLAIFFVFFYYYSIFFCKHKIRL